MQIRIEILEKGDEVLSFSDNKLAVKKKSGEVEIFILSMDKDNLPRIDHQSILITYGNPKSKKIAVTNKKTGVEVGTF